MSDLPEETLCHQEEEEERAMARRPGIPYCPVCLGEAVCTCPPPEELNADADPDGDWIQP